MREHIVRGTLRGRATLRSDHSYKADQYLPENHHIKDGIIYFPLGKYEAYVIDDVNYNPNGDLSLERQLDLISDDLGLERAEVEALLADVEVRQGSILFLDSVQTELWFKDHPEIKNRVIRTLTVARNKALEVIANSKPKRRVKRKWGKKRNGDRKARGRTILEG